VNKVVITASTETKQNREKTHHLTRRKMEMDVRDEVKQRKKILLYVDVFGFHSAA